MPPNKTNSVTIRDVAKKAGVSVATISRFLNNPDLIAVATAGRVQAAITELQFVPRAAAQSLSNRQTDTIGLLMPEIGWDHFFPPLLRGIETGCHENGYDLLIHSTRHTTFRPGTHRPVGEHNTDGLLLFIDCVPDAEIVRLHTKGFPLVLLHRTAPAGLPIPHLVFENKRGTHQIMDHLIEVHGYHRIAFLAGPENNEDAYWREQGYIQALQAHGLPFDPGLVRQGDFSEEVARQTVEQWLVDGLDADAICAADDDSAYGAIQALQSAGMRIPQDFAVVGFDDSPTSRLLTPPLTTVRAPIEESGSLAAHMLAHLIRGESASAEVLLPTEVIVRSSCGCSSP